MIILYKERYIILKDFFMKIYIKVYLRENNKYMNFSKDK